MKKKLHSFIKAACIFFPGIAIAQVNAVELKDGANASLGLYNNITNAYAAIPATLAQAYTIELKDIYTGAEEVLPVTFVAKTGASSINTIKIVPAANVNTVTLSGLSSGSSIFILNDADYIIIDGRPGGTGIKLALTLANTGTASNSNTVTLINGATNNIIRYCNISNGTTGSAGRNIAFSTSVSNPSGNSDNTVEYCILNAGRYNINSSGTAANPNTRNKLYGCEMRNIYFAGFWGQAGTGKITIDSCKFYSTAGIGDNPFAILFDAQTDTAIISRNHIYNIDNGTRTTAVKGIAIRTVTGTNLTIIHNNFISMSATNANVTSVVGIEYSTAAGTVTNANIYYNTVRILGSLSAGGTSGNVGSAAFQRTTSSSNAGNTFNLYNNIFVNERTGGNAGLQHVAMACVGTAGTFNLNNNTYRSATADFIRWGTTAYSSFAAYQSVPGGTNETNSNDQPVQFVSATDLHLSGSSLGDLLLKAQPLTGFSVDIDNEVRSASDPYRGGDESISSSLPLQLLTFGAQLKGADILLNWSTANEMNTRGFEILRSTDGNQFVPLGFVKSTGAAGDNYNFADKNATLVPGIKKWYYKLKQVDIDNKFKYSPIVSVTTNQIVKLLDFSSFPNPFTSELHAQIVSRKSGPAQLEVIKLSGEKLAAMKVNLLEGTTLVKLPVSNEMPVGTYLLRISIDNTSQVVKIVRQ
ncbi:MAG: T9SS type A sorting domain-containing protein [Bacteroidota bacterium]